MRTAVVCAARGPAPACQRPRGPQRTVGLKLLTGYLVARDLGADHSLMLDPTMVRLRTAAAAVGEDIWITVRLPGRYEGNDDLDDDLDDDAAITRWTTVVAHPDELGWLRQALALATDTDVGDEDDDEDDLEPLN